MNGEINNIATQEIEHRTEFSIETGVYYIVMVT